MNGKSVYIACPYSIGNQEEHVTNSIVTSHILADLGFIPFNPLLVHYWHIMYERSYEYWCDYTMYWLLKCNMVLRLPGESKGADAEVEMAIKMNIPVYYNIPTLLKNEKQ